MSETLITPVFTAAFTKGLFEAQAGQDGGKEKFSVTAIWDPDEFGKEDQARWDAIMAELDVVCLANFKKKWEDLPGNFKKGIRDGNEREGYAGFGEGKLFATLSSLEAPKISLLDGTVVSKSMGNTELVYPGCKMFAAVGVYAFDNKAKGVALGIRTGKKVADGKRIDGTGAAQKALDNAALDEKWLNQMDDEAF